MKKKYLLLPLLSICLLGCSQTDTINFKTYTETVKNDDGNFIVLISQPTCYYCNLARPYIDNYLKNNKDIKMYEISVELKNGNYKDNTMGNYKGENDLLKQLDDRIVEYRTVNNIEDDITITEDYYFKVLYTPLFIWYENNIEIKINNNFYETVKDENGNISDEAFASFMEFEHQNKNFDKTFDIG